MKPRLITVLPAMPTHADTLAELHATSFPEPWSGEDFALFLRQPVVAGWIAGAKTSDAFILIRRAGEEAEIMTLAVRPTRRRNGLARTLLDHAMEELRAQGIASCFLEVAVDNPGARALYARAGFIFCGVRRGYYERGNEPRADAVLMRRDL